MRRFLPPSSAISLYLVPGSLSKRLCLGSVTIIIVIVIVCRVFLRLSYRDFSSFDIQHSCRVSISNTIKIYHTYEYTHQVVYEYVYDLLLLVILHIRQTFHSVVVSLFRYFQLVICCFYLPSSTPSVQINVPWPCSWQRPRGLWRATTASNLRRRDGRTRLHSSSYWYIPGIRITAVQSYLPG